MWSIRSKTRTSVLSLTILSLLLIGILSTPIIASSTYQHTLTKGTDEFVVEFYDSVEWKTTVDSVSTPSDWFEGEANITNAKSKTTLKRWTTTTSSTFQVLTSVFMPLFFSEGEILLLTNVINGTMINNNYTNEYSLSYGVRSVWNYTSTEYEEAPSHPRHGITALQNPSEYKPMLDDYNELTEYLNGIFAIQILGYSFTNMSEEEFLWLHALNGLAIAEPHENYLESLITGLGCENASVSGSTLIIERYGVTSYTVEISYGERGMMSSFTVKDISDEVIYKITSSNSEWLFYLLLITVSAVSVALVVFAVVIGRKRKR